MVYIVKDITAICCQSDIVPNRHINEKINKWSQNFDERPHRWLVTPRVANGFIRPRPPSNNASLGQHELAPKRHFNWFMRFCVYHCNGSEYFSLVKTTPKIAHSPKGTGTHLIHGFLGPPESAPKRHLNRFNHFCTARKHDQQTDTLLYVAIGRYR